MTKKNKIWREKVSAELRELRALWSATEDAIVSLDTGRYLPPSLTPPARRAAELCEVKAITCRRHEPPRAADCPWEGHDHPACTYVRGHAGWGRLLHSWQADGDVRPTFDPHTPPPVVYTIPGPPPHGRSVIDQDGDRWTRQSDGEWLLTSRPPGVVHKHEWLELLEIFGPLTLADLTDEELASEALYGPVGQRWADPDGPPCPYEEGNPDCGCVETIHCTLRIGHGGPHLGADGQALGLDSTVTGPVAVTPQEAAKTLCTCGRPDQHQPGCPRYERMRHASPAS